MKRLFSNILLILSLGFFSVPLGAQPLDQEGPCLYGIKVEGECNPRPSDLSWSSSIAEENIAEEANPLRDEEICFCGISPAEEGVCLDDCEELKWSYERSDKTSAVFSSEDEDGICLWGILKPGECRAE